MSLGAHSNERLGIDIGGVIIEPRGGGDTSFFSENFLDTPPVRDSFEVIRRLRKEKFGDHIYLVSKCGPSTQEKTNRWLTHHDFFKITGVAKQQVYFCLTRPEKAPICKGLGLTSFVDDREEVLSYLTSVHTRILLNSSVAAEHTDFFHATSWPEIESILLNTQNYDMSSSGHDDVKGKRVKK